MYIVACNYTYIAPLLLLFLVPLHYQYRAAVVFLSRLRVVPIIDPDRSPPV